LEHCKCHYHIVVGINDICLSSMENISAAEYASLK
jgi:hypothetical protein